MTENNHSRQWHIGTSILVGLGLVLLCTQLIAFPTIALANNPNFTEERLFGFPTPSTRSIAIGDMDSDGDLDIITGNGEQNIIYLNDGNGYFPISGRNFGTSTNNTMSVAVGDMDGDGDLDIVTGNGFGDSPDGEQNAVYLNDGSGNFSTPGIYFGTGEDLTQCIALGDMDGDGDLDIVTGNANINYGDEQNVVYLNDGSGNFPAPGRDFGTGTDKTYSVAVGDMDGDDDLDIITGNNGQNVVYLNDGNGNFSTLGRNFGTGADYTESVTVGDMDDDGDLDIVTGNTGDPIAYEQNVVYLNDGNGNFSSPGHNFGTGEDYTYSVAVGDMDDDGDLDIVTGNIHEQNVVYLNDGRGNFSTPGVNFGIGADDTMCVAVGDMTGDNHLDIITANGFQNVVYLNDGSGNLPNPGRNFGTGVDSTESVAVGDMDDDGDLDIVTGNAGQQNVVYLNEGNGDFLAPGRNFGTGADSTPSLAVGDMDGDGDLDIVTGDSMVYLNDGNGNFLTPGRNFGTGADSTQSVVLGDMDGDGDLDIVAGNYHQQNIVYLNDGSGNFSTFGRNFGTGADYTWSVAVGDMDNDGDLDIVTGNFHEQNVVYMNDGNGNFATFGYNFGIGVDYTTSVAVGDTDDDGDLDIITGNWGHQNTVYLNDGNSNFLMFGRNFGTSIDETQSVAVGDMDGDSDLDIVVGNGYANSNEQNVVYLNDGIGNFLALGRNVGIGADHTRSVTVGDMDGDGDLDIVTGNYAQQNTMYLNGIYPAWGIPMITAIRPISTANAGFHSSPIILDTPIITVPFTIFDPGEDRVGSVQAFYSLDGGDNWQLAIANAITTNLSSSGLTNIVGYWPFDEGTLTTTVDASGHSMIATLYGPSWTTDTTPILGANPHALSFDGIDDYVEIIHDPRQNPGEELTLAIWVKLDNVANGKIIGKGWGAGYSLGFNNGHLYPEIWDTSGIRYFFQEGNIPVETWTHLAITWQSGGYFRGYVNGEQVWQISASNDPIGTSNDPLRIGASSWDSSAYLVNGNIDDARIYQRALSAVEIASLANGSCVRGCNHTFIWDTFASGFFGQSDNVVFRLEAYPQPTTTGVTGTYHYTNAVPGPFQRPYASATTFPFRVRGTQVQVFTNTVTTGNELAKAIVYRLPAGQVDGAALMTNEINNQVWQTDANGYLPGRGRLSPGDQIIALYPVTSTDSYTLYHTSATPTTTGLDMFTVTQPGVQELAILAENNFILFDLDVSLEWDAREDTTFLQQLENDLKRTSQILYDLSNGQVALGEIRVYHDRQEWQHAHITIQANNSQRPSAILGGIVMTPTNDIGVTGVITNAFLPGQVRMGATWNRFGDPGGTLGEDWPRALAHELSHYLLYLPDNYLGLTENNSLTFVNCAGSAMTNPYTDAASEYLTRSEWDNDPECLHTLAERYLGRADWETVTHFYSMLNGDENNINSGPSALPLAVTQITFIDPITPTHTIDAPFFSLVDTSGAPSPIPSGQGQGYLLQTNNTSQAADDYLVPLGSPVGDLILARGAEPSDRLCVYDYSQDPLRLGCDDVEATAGSIQLHPLSDWAPQITVTPVNTRTFSITVTNVSETALNVQLLPLLGAPSEPILMTLAGGDFVQTVTLENPAFAGYAWVTVPGSSPSREMVVEFIDMEAWDGRMLSWGGRMLSWGGRMLSWGAPMMSTDGQVSIFALDEVFGEGGDYSLQVLPQPPALPSWLALVGGSAYRVQAEDMSDNATILFRYLGQDVPAGYEGNLNVYYSPDGGQTWERLPTELNVDYNHASATMPGNGIYALVATIEMPSFAQGWNLFGYPVAGTRPVTMALASIEGAYSSIYTFDSTTSPQWRLYDTTVIADHPDFAALVNDLAELEFGRGYWLYATRATTLYLGVDSSTYTFNAPMSNTGLEFPPATFYGSVVAEGDFTPTTGMPVTAMVNGIVCGQTQVQSWKGELAYKIQVTSDTGNGCGALGQEITFVVDGQAMPGGQLWGNSHACYYPLDVDNDGQSVCFQLHKTFLPVVIK